MLQDTLLSKYDAHSKPKALLVLNNRMSSRLSAHWLKSPSSVILTDRFTLTDVCRAGLDVFVPQEDSNTTAELFPCLIKLRRVKGSYISASRDSFGDYDGQKARILHQ